MVQLDGNDGASFRIFDLKGAIENTDLEPMISIELRNQVSCLVTEGKFLRVTGEHDFGDVNAKDLPLLCLRQTIEKDVIDCSFSATYDSFFAIFIQKHGLVLHVDLLFELQVLLAKDEDFPLESDVDV